VVAVIIPKIVGHNVLKPKQQQHAAAATFSSSSSNVQQQHAAATALPSIIRAFTKAMKWAD